jgi:hypothetical protein
VNFERSHALIVEKKNFQNWYSVPQGDVGLILPESPMTPTGEGKECLAQKRRVELAEAARKIGSKPSR